MRHSITKALSILVGVATFAAAAAAQLPTTYTSGDFLVGFRQVGGNANSVVVDLGQIPSFTTAFTFTIDAGSTLSAQYGAGWATDANVYFSLISTSATDNTNYVTSAGYPDYPAKVWGRLTSSNSGVLQNKVARFGAEFNTGGIVQPKSDPDAYANFMPGGIRDGGHATQGNIAWGFFNPTSEGNLGQGTAGVTLDLIQLVAATGPNVNAPGNDLGNFRLSADGNRLTYTPYAVPEPATWAAVLGGASLLGLVLRRHCARLT